MAVFNGDVFNGGAGNAPGLLDNLVVHIVLPKGLALVDGRTLSEETSMMSVGQITPWYASTDQVRLEGGAFVQKLSDFTLAAQIWQASKNADALTCQEPALPAANILPSDLGFRKWRLFNHARNNFVTQQAALDTLIKSADIAGVRGAKTLGNFSVSRMEFNRGHGFPKLIDDLRDEIKKWKIVIQSGGEIGFGGHARAGMAAKGIYDTSDAPAGRLWRTSGMGANHTTVAGWGSSGKPIKYGSPPMTNWRIGRDFGNYCTIFPKVIYT